MKKSTLNSGIARFMATLKQLLIYKFGDNDSQGNFANKKKQRLYHSSCNAHNEGNRQKEPVLSNS